MFLHRGLFNDRHAFGLRTAAEGYSGPDAQLGAAALCCAARPPARGTPMTAFQDLIPDNNCWGCGPHNPTGLHVRSHWEGDVAICEFSPRPDHCAGPAHVVNGGIIASVIDCHAV